MYQKTHHRLTLLFTLITSLIMLIMSLVYLQMSEHDQQTNARLSFSGDMKTLINTCEQQRELTYEWMSKMEFSGGYSIAAYDNGIPLSFNQRLHNAAKTARLTEVYDYCQTQMPLTDTGEQTSAYHSVHKEFSYHSRTEGDFYICNASIAGYAGNLQLIVISDAPKLLHKRFLTQCMIFAAIDLLVLVILFLFSWFFTGRLLVPIEENQRRQTQFVAMASHELRTPLAVILSASSALQKADASRQTHFLRIIESEGQQMSALIGDMLTLASADQHTWHMHPTMVELDTLCLNCCESFSPMARERGVTLNIELPDQMLSPCRCDEKRIRQVLTILLHNACSYVAPGGCIGLSLAQNPTGSVICVWDNGPGISDVDKPHVFERFYRSAVTDGTMEHFGLGLCVAKEIVDAHHGQIMVTDTAGGGTTFTVVLPLN